MKRYVFLALLAAVPCGLMGYVAYAEDQPGIAVLVGLACGVGAGAFMAGFAWWRDQSWERWAAKTATAFSAECVVHASYASTVDAGAVVFTFLFMATGMGARAVERGGALVLTQQRLVFIPHRQNRYGKRMEVAVSDIAGARAVFGLAPNTIDVFTRANNSAQFRVRNRDTWLAKLPGVKQSAG